MSPRSGVRVLKLRVPGSFPKSEILDQDRFLPDFREPLSLAVVVAEDMNGITVPQPAVELVEKLAALDLGNLRVGRAFAERTKGLE